MVKTFCDRCGKEIQGNKYGWIRHKIRYAEQRLIPSCMREDWKDTDKYICPDCEEQYIHWFMNPEPPEDE
jgi:hypothetical protein